MMEVRTAVICSAEHIEFFLPFLKYLIMTPQEANVGGSGLGEVSQPGTDGHCDVRRVKKRNEKQPSRLALT